MLLVLLLLQYPKTCWVKCLELHTPQNPKGKATRQAVYGKTEFKAKSSDFLRKSQSIYSMLLGPSPTSIPGKNYEGAK